MCRGRALSQGDMIHYRVTCRLRLSQVLLRALSPLGPWNVISTSLHTIWLSQSPKASSHSTVMAMFTPWSNHYSRDCSIKPSSSQTNLSAATDRPPRYDGSRCPPTYRGAMLPACKHKREDRHACSILEVPLKLHESSGTLQLRRIYRVDSQPFSLTSSSHYDRIPIVAR